MKHLILLTVVGAVVFTCTTSTTPAQTTIPFKVIRTVTHTQGYGSGLAWENDTLWVGNAFGNVLEKHDPYTSTRIKTITAPNSKVRDLTFDGMDLWMASWYAPPTASIFTIDPVAGKVLKSLVAPFTSGHSDGMAYDGATLWITDESNHIFQVHPTQWGILATLNVPAAGSYNPRGLAWDNKSNNIWAGYQSAAVIRKHNPQNGTIIEEFKSPYGSMQQGLAWDGWFLWATGGGSQKDMSQIDVTMPFMVLKGSLTPNTNIQFELTRADNQSGNIFVVGWSGSGTAGFPVGSATIPLTFDSFTVAGLSLLPFFSMVVDTSGSATTVPFTWPNVPGGIPFWVCGVTLDTQGVVSVNEPIKYVTR